jgi:ABC-type phosphate transport system substrate-binding protein
VRVRVLKNRGGRRATALAATLALIAAAALGTGAAAENDYVLIRNARNPVTKLTRSELKDMAIGKKKVWPQGQVVQMVLGPAGSPELGWFTSTVVGAPEATFLAKVRQEVFKGEMRKPIVATGDKDCFEAVASDPGALGVVRASTASNLPPEVALVTIR